MCVRNMRQLCTPVRIFLILYDVITEHYIVTVATHCSNVIGRYKHDVFF